MIDFYTGLSSKFNADEHRHYSFTPRNLTQIIFGLLRYELSKESLGEALYNELSKKFKDKLINID